MRMMRYDFNICIQHMSNIIKNLFHIFFVGGLFLYIASNRENTPIVLYNFLFILGLAVFIIHAFIAYFTKTPYLLWINAFHMLLVAPLLVYIGYHKNKTERKYYEMLLLLAFSAIGYHSYYLFLDLANK